MDVQFDCVGRLENERSGLIGASRVFEHSDDEITDRFKPGGRLGVPAVAALSTIFMEEGISDQIAGIGWLSRVELRSKEYQLHYTLDPEIPRMTNADINALASELQIGVLRLALCIPA